MTKNERKEIVLENRLYGWIKEVNEFEDLVCQLIDKTLSKKELIVKAKEVKVRFRQLEDYIKKY